MTKKESLLVLNALPDIGSSRMRQLIDCFGSADKILEASYGELISVSGIGGKIANSILNWQKFFDLDRELKHIKSEGIDILTIEDPCYPELLKNIYDPPIILYVKGNKEILRKNCISIVGARKASFYGLNTARRFARELAARGFCIISGLARGIDTASHEGAVEGGGKTVAVFGCGLNVIYPSENKKLASKVIENGAIISEFPINTRPDRRNFPRRNRIISGIGMGVIIVEAGKHSGSLITARLAAEQGREVFSIPGRINEITAQGTNILIREGAKPVLELNDILEEFRHIVCSKKDIPIEGKNGLENKNTLNSCENRLYSILGQEQKEVDNIVEETGFSTTEVLIYLSNLELKGLIQRLPGNKYIVKN